MAGDGRRFKEAGYTTPKPFIRIDGRTITSLVLENLTYPGARFLLVARRDHAMLDPDAMAELQNHPGVDVDFVDTLTEGPACTVLEAIKRVGTDDPILIANCDQWIEHGISDMVDRALAQNIDGSIMVFEDEGDPKWSFAKIDKNGFVVEVAEKNPISKLATVGLYFFASAGKFISGLNAMIDANDRVNGEFYTCPVYNYLIERGEKVGIYEIAKSSMYGLGTPTDLERFQEEMPHTRPL